MHEQHIHINGTGLFYAEEGSWRPCVLLPGGPGLDHQADLSKMEEVFSPLSRLY